ncbi:MAG: hypothetical protein HY235_10640, partial [Acidobacteria bacterium]|nr:hypothetical protein [Acidobacteriota bacterium]
AEVRVVAHRSSEKLRLELWGLETEWRALPLPQIPQPTAGLNLKPAVVRLLRREGIGYLLMSPGHDTYGLLATNVERNPEEWSLEWRAGQQGVALYALAPER